MPLLVKNSEKIFDVIEQFGTEFYYQKKYENNLLKEIFTIKITITNKHIAKIIKST